jgi:hypothetical protein
MAVGDTMPPLPAADPAQSLRGINGTLRAQPKRQRVGEWTHLTTTYTDPNGYEDISSAFFILDRWPSVASGGLFAGYIESWDLPWLEDGGVSEPGELTLLSTAYATLDSGSSSVSGVGDTLTIRWYVRPDVCLTGRCGWNHAVEFVTDSTGSQAAGLVGWWRLDEVSGPVQDARPAVKPTEADVERSRKEIEAWRSGLSEP